MDVASIIAYMIDRRLKPRLNFLLHHNSAVALLGPRQSGKTTLALEIARQRSSVYLDLEDENDRAKLTNPSQYLEDHESDLVILDEVHRVPEIFQQLRGVIDRGRRRGKANGRLLLLGSAAMDLLKQSGESLAGRVSAQLPRRIGRFESAVAARFHTDLPGARYPSVRIAYTRRDASSFLGYACA